MLRRGKKVESAAKRRISVSPKRVETGNLRSRIDARLFSYRWTYGSRIGTNVFYALWVHNGTGLYGPRHMKILPKKGKYLRFVPKGSSEAVFARSVKGMRPNPFLKDALPAARG